MSEILIVGGVAAVLGIALVVSNWKVSSCLKSILDSTNRSVERERRDYLQLVEKLLEKRDVLPQNIPDLAALHAQERVQRVGADAQTDMASVPRPSPSQNNNPKGKPDIVNTDSLAETEARMF